MVPFLDLKAQHKSIKSEIAVAFQSVIEQTAFAGGPFVEQFEGAFAEFCQTRYSIGVSSGTSALWLALMALDVGKGDEVITAANTFIATAEAISFSGAKPVFVDVDEQTYNINPELLEATISSRTKAIIPVHLFGQMADMDPIMEIARRHELFVIEDASQAHGATYKGRLAGSIGDAGCFSFYPGKNLGAYGEAGAVVTNNKELETKLRIMRNHGQTKKYYHSMIGWNARMDGLQGAFLSVKLKHLAAWNETRRNNAQLYTKLLADVDGVVVPREADYSRHVYHIYAIRVKERDALIRALAEKNIHCGIHYPVPLHLTEAYRFLGFRQGNFPITEKYAEELLSLPMFPELPVRLIESVACEIKHIYQAQGMHKELYFMKTLA
ncbi:MAG: DegT/DnrJ/EryC1/StrS family aminotransferase [Bacteroidetes bacterium]|nr:DegT/DnrJ/EryC1/StrS family aminotransferase [Bacteroidota bacterium]